MKFKIIGTKIILEPNDKSVEDAYIVRPDIYEPIKVEKRTIKTVKAGEKYVFSGGDK